MKITLQPIKIKDLIQNYKDDAELGVHGYYGRLNIRPAYQREFVYDDKHRNAVIESILKGWPLNTMYWAKNADGSFELLDGQQRTISICQFCTGDYSINVSGNQKTFANLPDDLKKQILEYELLIYICEGNDKDKLEWFEVINISGVPLTAQELRNAAYVGPWLSDAKVKFSKTNCKAYNLAKDYVNGSPIRQELLETALEWISARDGEKDVTTYMAKHQFDPNADDLWNYFETVINWAKKTFITYRKEMKSLPWGDFYLEAKDRDWDPKDLEKRIAELYADEDVQNLKGIYSYLIYGREKYLNIRMFSERDKARKYEEQKHICPYCNKEFKIEEMEGDHVIPWHKGGKTAYDNLQMLCMKCNREKSGK